MACSTGLALACLLRSSLSADAGCQLREQRGLLARLQRLENGATLGEVTGAAWAATQGEK